MQVSQTHIIYITTEISPIVCAKETLLLLLLLLLLFSFFPTWNGDCNFDKTLRNTKIQKKQQHYSQIFNSLTSKQRRNAKFILNSIIPLTIIHSCMRHTNQWINWQASNLHSTTTWLNSSCATMDGERSATQWHDFIVFPSCATIQFNSIQFHSISLSLSLSGLWLIHCCCEFSIFNLQFKNITPVWTWDRSSIITHF